MNRSRRFIALILIAVMTFLIPTVVKSGYWLGVLNLLLLYVILGLGLNLIAGYTGLLSFGHAAFYGLGAYTAGILLTRSNLPFLLVLLLSGLIAFAAGFVLSTSTARVRGDYFVIITIIFGEVFRLVAQAWRSFTGGAMGIVGIPAPKIFSWTMISEKDYFFFGLILFWFTYVTLHMLVKSKYGRAFVAIREDQLAASAAGINTTLYKILAFSIGTFYAGIAGCYSAVYNTAIDPSGFTLAESCLMVIMVVLGGSGNLLATIPGVAVMVIITEAFRPLYHYRILLIGFIMVAIIVRYPYGFWGIYQALSSRISKYAKKKA